MGIHGLLPLLRSIMQPIHAQDLRGQTVAVDTYCWLHKGAVSCSVDLCKGIPTTKHIDYCMHRIKLLQYHGVKLVLVFDGGLLPMKFDQETKRARKRKENLERALEHEAAGNSTAAFDCYQKAVDITPSIAFELVQVLIKEKIDYIVAPYEADAQMTFLSIYKQVDAVITEDSDLIPFGCSRIIFKMDKFGQGVEFQSSKLGQNGDLDFTGFNKQMILEMCILGGCDYLPSLPSMGLKRAYALIRKYKSYDKVTKHLRYSGISIPPHYEETFRKAVWAFQHQRVYDPQKECIVHLSDIPNDRGEEDLDFLGPYPYNPFDIVKGIAKGELDPLTKMPFQAGTAGQLSIEDNTLSMYQSKPTGRGRRLDLPVQKNVLTNYFCLASIQAKRKFKAPKPSPGNISESASSSFCGHDSDLPTFDRVSLSSTSNKCTGSLFNSRDPNDELPVTDYMNNVLHDGCSKALELPSQECPADKRCPSSLLESHQHSIQPFLKFHEEYGTKSKCLNFDSRKSPKTKNTSPYFQSNSTVEAGEGSQNDDSFKKKDDDDVALDDHLMPMGETSIKRRKTAHLPDERVSLGRFKSSLATSGQGNHISGLQKDNGEVKTNSFGRDISHVEEYCGIAEKSMERFVSLMNSFRYNSSGSRASGLRAPLRDVRNTCPIRSSKPAPDFEEFAYKHSRNGAEDYLAS
ncbi:hypothetical protein HPP92_017214 [Vanilla planifolia]|nr:hypothetical protein HPP92_017214 [Vanilla planifolia]